MNPPPRSTRRVLLRFGSRMPSQLSIDAHVELATVSSQFRDAIRWYQRQPILTLCMVAGRKSNLLFDSNRVDPALGLGLAQIFTLELDDECVPVLQMPARIAPQSGSLPALPGLVRIAGSFVRTLLVTVAAARWRVPPAACVTASGIVTHLESDRSVDYEQVGGWITQEVHAPVELRSSRRMSRPSALGPTRRMRRFDPLLYSVESTGSWRLIETVYSDQGQRPEVSLDGRPVHTSQETGNCATMDLPSGN
jgi:hypothetical protein